MKHIERKFLNTYTEEEYRGLTEKSPERKFIIIDRGSQESDSIKIKPEAEVYAHTVNGFYLRSSVHTFKSNRYLFPEPDPTLIYFSSAQRCIREINVYREKLLPKIDLSKSIVEEVIHDYYEYFGAVCGSVVFMFTAVESFMNSKLSEDYRYSKKGQRSIETYDKNGIERWISFDEKLSQIMPDIFKRNFKTSFEFKFGYIKKLQDFRDRIIHTKTDKGVFAYDHIVKRSLEFNYERTIEYIADFMNFYVPGYIKECPCDKDF